MKIVSFNNCFILLLLLSLSSCSWLSKKSRYNQDDMPTISRNGKAISNEQYNDLLHKYDSLRREREAGMMGKDTRALVSDLGNVPDFREDRSDQQIAAPIYQNHTSTLADTVDVFAEDGPGTKEPSVVELGKLNEPDRFPVSVNTEIKQFQSAQKAMQSGDANQAMKMYKILEKSNNHQLKVRAKYNIAEILFDQKDYDLAMQAYEEIIKSHAFSGFVIKSLGRLIVCAENLKMKEKKDKYYSILHDFFERE